MTSHYYYGRPCHSGYLGSCGSSDGYSSTSLLPYTSSPRSTYMPASYWSMYHPPIYASYPRVSIYSVSSTPRTLTYHAAIPRIAHHRLWDASPIISTRERLLRYSALYDDDDDLEPIMTQGQKYNPVSSLESTFSNTIQDIEDDIRNWRYAASSVLNRFTSGKPANAELTKLADRYSSGRIGGTNYYGRGSSSSYYRPLALKSREYSKFEAPIYDSGRCMYVSSRSKDWDSPKSTIGNKSNGTSDLDTVGKQASSLNNSSNTSAWYTQCRRGATSIHWPNNFFSRRSLCYQPVPLRWRGSLYKLCYKELACFLVLFCTNSAIYRQALNSEQKSFFEKVVRYCDKYVSMVPLSFILGFYVTTIATRWWQQCMALPWPDRVMLSIITYIPGSDHESKLLRKTLVQYLTLMAVLVFRTISESVQLRLKTLEDVVSAGFMTKAEMECYKGVKAECNLFWLPGIWFCHRLREAQVQGRIIDPLGTQLIVKEFLDFRSRCGLLWTYDWVSIPLVYTQVVTLSTYSFIFACLFARQNVDTGTNDITMDAYFPVWTLLQILFYMGLLKVAENMVHPHGEDDEDFNLSFLLNRHTKATNVGTHLFTSEMCPPMEADHLQSGIGIHTPLASQKTSHNLKNRMFRPKLAEFYAAKKEKNEPTNKRQPENNSQQQESIPTISMSVPVPPFYSLDLTLLPDEPDYQGKRFSWNL